MCEFWPTTEAEDWKMYYRSTAIDCGSIRTFLGLAMIRLEFLFAYCPVSFFLVRICFVGDGAIRRIFLVWHAKD